MSAVGFLHTSDVHVASFRALLADQAPELEAVDIVDHTLLRDAQAGGVDADVRHRLQTQLRALCERGSAVVVCTCSTLSGAAEQLADSVGAPIVRIDRPMAELAASIGGRIAVVAALRSTMAPTMELLAECVAKSGRESTLLESLCRDAWALFEAGDTRGYLDRIAEHAREVARQADVIVLAQASMAAAAEQLARLPIPVLCSPAAAVQYAVALARQ